MKVLIGICKSCRKRWDWHRGFDTCPRCGNMIGEAYDGKRYFNVKRKGNTFKLVHRKDRVRNPIIMMKNKGCDGFVD